MRLLRGLFVMFLLVSGVVPASAQRTTGEITGAVTDDSGLVLPGVTVTLRGAGVPSAGLVSVSAENGGYRFANLAPGTYENYRSDFGLSQQFMTGGMSAFGGFRTGFGDFPTYNLGQKTADAGEFRGGLGQIMEVCSLDNAPF